MQGCTTLIFKALPVSYATATLDPELASPNYKNQTFPLTLKSFPRSPYSLREANVLKGGSGRVPINHTSYTSPPHFLPLHSHSPQPPSPTHHVPHPDLNQYSSHVPPPRLPLSEWHMRHCYTSMRPFGSRRKVGGVAGGYPRACSDLTARFRFLIPAKTGSRAKC